jgi:hypothetical protein
MEQKLQPRRQVASMSNWSEVEDPRRRGGEMQTAAVVTSGGWSEITVALVEGDTPQTTTLSLESHLGDTSNVDVGQ